jgi:hypothetical protein
MLALAVAAIVLAGVLGFLIARSGGGGSAPAAVRLATAGPVQISYPSTWRERALPPAQTAGLTNGLAVGPAGPSPGLLVIGTSPPDSAHPLAQPLRAALTQTTAANVLTLGGIDFNVYPGSPAVGGSFYALPTTAGTVFAMCLSSAPASGFTHSCQRVLGSLRLTSGRILPPGQSATYASAVNQAMSRLNAARTKAAAQLRDATTGTAQAAAATQLAAAHTTAASALAQLTSVGPATAANAAVVTALRATASAYTALARAATDNDAAGYSQATSALTQAQDSLQSALTRLGSLGYQVG